MAAIKHAALCPKGRCHVGDTNALAFFAKKTNSSALVSQNSEDSTLRDRDGGRPGPRRGALGGRTLHERRRRAGGHGTGGHTDDPSVPGAQTASVVHGDDARGPHDYLELAARQSGPDQLLGNVVST